jgi:hypothetical protein
MDELDDMDVNEVADSSKLSKEEKKVLITDSMTGEFSGIGKMPDYFMTNCKISSERILSLSPLVIEKYLLNIYV